MKTCFLFKHLNLNTCKLSLLMLKIQNKLQIEFQKYLQSTIYTISNEYIYFKDNSKLEICPQIKKQCIIFKNFIEDEYDGNYKDLKLQDMLNFQKQLVDYNTSKERENEFQAEFVEYFKNSKLRNYLDIDYTHLVLKEESIASDFEKYLENKNSNVPWLSSMASKKVIADIEPKLIEYVQHLKDSFLEMFNAPYVIIFQNIVRVGIAPKSKSKVKTLKDWKYEQLQLIKV
jgi:hypothetical protein